MYVVAVMATIGLAVMLADRPTVFQALTSGSSFQPLTRLACNDSMSLTLKLARAPVWSSGMLKNRIERE